MIRITKQIRAGLIAVVDNAKSKNPTDQSVIKALDWLQHYIDKHEVVGGKITHGGWTYHRQTYKVWQSMIERCENNKHKSFASYGGRGISVCNEWKSFPAFFADMGDAPPNKSIDRKDNDKGYSKENCRWATPTEQAQNRRTTIYVIFEGEKMSLSHACKKTGVRYSTALGRYKKGYSVDVVLDNKSYMGRRDMKTGALKGAEVLK